MAFRWRAILASCIGGAVGGGIAIGICAVVSAILFWPIGAVVSTFGFSHPASAPYSLTSLAGGIIFGRALLGGAAVAGPAGTLLDGALKWVLRYPVSWRWGRSSLSWGGGCVLAHTLSLDVAA